MKKLLLTLAVASSLITIATPGTAQVGVSVRIGAPPPPRFERVPVAPGRGYFWRPGHWFWNGSAYAWSGGSYIRRPAGAVWIPGHWRQRRRGAGVWVEGHWR